MIKVVDLAPANYPRNAETDWAPYIQQAVDSIDAVHNSGGALDTGTILLPPGRLGISFPIIVASAPPASGSYAYASAAIVSDSPGYGGSLFHGTELVPWFNDKPGLIFQSVRASSLGGVSVTGKNSWSAGVGALFETYVDDANFVINGCRDNPRSPYAGIAIDPFHANVPVADRYPGMDVYYTNTGSGGGSSIIEFHKLEVRNFVVGLAVSLNGSSQNADNYQIDNCLFESNKSAIAVGQSQSRNISCRDVRVVGARTAYDCTNYGNGIGSTPVIHGGTVVLAKNVLETNRSGGGQGSIAGLYCENIMSIGMLAGKSGESYNVNGCTFKFWDTPSGQGSSPYHLAVSAAVSFTGCRFAFQGVTNDPLYFSVVDQARASFDSCAFYNDAGDTNAKFFINGKPHQVSFRNCTMTGIPKLVDLSDEVRVDTFANVTNNAVLPGTVVKSVYDGTQVRVVSTAQPLVPIQSSPVTWGPLGTATFTLDAAAVGLVAVGDIIYRLKNAQPFAGTAYGANAALDHSVAIGKVSAIVDNVVHLRAVPRTCTATADASSAQLYVAYLTRMHRPCTALAHSDPDHKVLVNVTNASDWRVGERIRDKQGRIKHGTYVTAVDAAGGKLTLSREPNAGAQPVVDLYDAHVSTLSMAQL